MSLEHLWNNTERAKPEYSEINLPSAILSSFTTRPIYLQENGSLYSLKKSSGESQNPDTWVIRPVAELSSITERSF